MEWSRGKKLQFFNAYLSCSKKFWTFDNLFNKCLWEIFFPKQDTWKPAVIISTVQNTFAFLFSTVIQACNIHLRVSLLAHYRFMDRNLLENAAKKIEKADRFALINRKYFYNKISTYKSQKLNLNTYIKTDRFVRIVFLIFNPNQEKEYSKLQSFLHNEGVIRKFLDHLGSYNSRYFHLRWPWINF